MMLSLIFCSLSVFSLFPEGQITDIWAGHRTHPAVVNPVSYEKFGRPPSVISLAGEWDLRTCPHGSGLRSAQYVNDIWTGHSRKVRVPSCWEAAGVGEPGRGISRLCQDSSPKMLRHVFAGEGYYRRFFDVPTDWAGKRIWLKAGGVHSQGWFIVNDHPVAMLDTNVGAWKWDVSDCVRPGPSNKIVVVANNVVAGRGGPGASCNRWGGLWRDVELEATPLVSIDDAWIRPRFDENAAEACVVIDCGRTEECREAKTGKARGAGRGSVEGVTIRVTVDGRSASTPAREGGNAVVVPMPGFREWTTEEPFLYWATVELVKGGEVIQTRHERFGMRKLEVRGKDLYFNNRPFFARGAGDNSPYPLTGMTPADRDFHRAHMSVAHRAGFNMFRQHTHSEPPEYMEAADEFGILIEPEIPYYLDNPDDYFSYDPKRDADAIVTAFRRYTSFAVLSFGNEALLGPGANRILYEHLKQVDPDRLVLAQDGGTYCPPDFAVGESDYLSGPLATWKRGICNARAFICHEYLNLAVKYDWRIADDFTGLWLPPMTMEDRRRPLAHTGLSDEWLCRLQDAANDLQHYWLKNGLEHARADPYCDGYLFWTICDSTPFNKKAQSVIGQGALDVFWRTKRHGVTVEELGVINAPAILLLDTETAPRDMTSADWDICLYAGGNFCGAPYGSREGTNRVYRVGETIAAKYLFANYGKAPVADATLEWKLVADGRTLAAGEKAVGDLPLGHARQIAELPIVVPPVDRPVRATIAATLKSSKPTTARISNSWPVWIFPPAKPLSAANVVVAAYGSDAAAAARAAGKNLLVVAPAEGGPNVVLGWWNVGKQCGTAFLPHPAMGAFPHEPYLSPVHFRIFREGLKLPVAGYGEKDYVVVGEGCKDAYLYLAAKERPDGSREVLVAGLDIDADKVEAVTLRNGLIDWLSKGK